MALAFYNQFDGKPTRGHTNEHKRKHGFATGAHCMNPRYRNRDREREKDLKDQRALNTGPKTKATASDRKS